MSSVGKFSPYVVALRGVGIAVLLFSLSAIAAAQHYNQTNLVSDLPGHAAHKDPNLVNAWGIARAPGGPWWVADNGTGVSTLYDSTGAGFPPPPHGPLVVHIPTPPDVTPPAAPTGIVFNGSPDFEVAPGMPAIFIFVTEDGTISGWNPGADLFHAVLKVSKSPGAVYKGVTIAEADGSRLLYAANFRAGRIDIFNKKFERVKFPADAFTDSELPAGFVPFNVQNIGRNLYVTFAKQDDAKHDQIDGEGLGYVDVFDPEGKLLLRLEHGIWLNSPWGVALAPGDFGEFSHHILVGNFGSGHIAAFNSVSGKFAGVLKNPDGTILTVDRIWGISFGNSAIAGPYNALFFAAGPQDEHHGLFGMITAVDAEQDGDEQ